MQIKRHMREENNDTRNQALRELFTTVVAQDLELNDILTLQELVWLYKRHSNLFECLVDSLINEIEAPASLN